LEVLALALLLGATQSEIEKKRVAFISIALNPLILFESISFAHGDILMLVLLAAAFVLYRNGRYCLCACLCVLAVETRLTAIFASVALFAVLLYSKRYADMLRVVLVSAITALTTWGWSVAAFGVFRLTGSAIFFSHYDAPLTIVATLLLGGTVPALMIGTLLQSGIGIVLGYAALRERLFSLMPVAALATLPVLEPWYAQWLAPLAVLTSNRAYRVSICVFMLLAPTTMFTDMVPVPNFPVTRSLTVMLQWALPLLTYVYLSADARRSTHASAAMAIQ